MSYSSRVWYLRYLLLITATFSVGTRVVLALFNGPTPLHPFRFFTTQSNFMVLIWTALAIIWRSTDKYDRLTGFVKGALTTYISITMVVFILLIEPLYDPVGIDWWTSLFNHYLNPIFFITDFIMAERKTLQWRWPVIWLVYPLAYLGFALIWGALYGEYVYFFVNVEELGVGGLLLWTAVLSLLFLGFGSLYTYLNRKYLAPTE